MSHRFLFSLCLLFSLFVATCCVRTKPVVLPTTVQISPPPLPEPLMSVEPIPDIPAAAPPAIKLHRIARLDFDGRISDESVDQIKAALTASLVVQPETLVVILNSPGGELEAGFLLTKALENYPTKVICIVDGAAASMAFYVLQGCDVRIMTRRSHLMAHNPYLIADRGAVLDRDVLDRMLRDDQLTSERWSWFAGRRLNISLKDFRKKIYKRDWDMNADEALAVGAVDGLVDSANRTIASLLVTGTTGADTK